MAMETWTGRNAIVTGAASGIGLSLARALVNRKVVVHLVDVDEPGLDRAKSELGPHVQAHGLDVRDAAALRDLIERIARDEGRIDYLFNNAGTGTSGEAHEIAVDHYDRLIDVNIRGVVHGVTAAYPIMVRQQHGHLVNTASLAGVIPVPLMVPYAMTKHAIVGLSTSLRIEAARHGVRVSVLCPAAVDTPLLDAEVPEGLSALPWRPHLRDYLARGTGPPCSSDRLAEDALAGVERNERLIILPARAQHVARLYRFAPAAYERRSLRVLDDTLRQRG